MVVLWVAAVSALLLVFVGVVAGVVGVGGGVVGVFVNVVVC